MEVLKFASLACSILPKDEQTKGSKTSQRAALVFVVEVSSKLLVFNALGSQQFNRLSTKFWSELISARKL